MSTTYPQFPATTFPDSIQAIAQFVDITASDANNIAQFKEQYLAGDYDTAMTFLQAIPNYQNKTLTASKLNQIADTVQALEQFYGSDITSIITQKQAEWQAIIDQFTYRGNWASATAYKKNNIVGYYNTNRGRTYLYIATRENTNVAPVGAVTPAWVQLTIEGIRGSASPTGTFQFNWENDMAYVANDVVSHNNSWWVALSGNTNQEPSSTSSYWSLILSLEPKQYQISATTPADIADGGWYGKIVQ